jgi:hypothetical protein
MSLKPFYITLHVIIISILFFHPSYAVFHVAVSPPATSAWDDCNGNIRTINGVLPGDWKENEEVVTQWGSYSNKVYCTSTQWPYKLQIKLAGPLSSGANVLPVSSLKYIYTYAYNITHTKEATGTKNYYGSYVNFLDNIYADVYTCSSTDPDDIPILGTHTVDWEHQFKYAVQVPNNQPPGTYTGRISYRVEGIGGGMAVESYADITVTVGNYFRLSIDRGSIDFEKMSGGETKDNVPVEGIIITSKTNVGNPWYLKISNDSPLSTGPYLIPNSNFIWYGWSDGTGRWYGNGTNAMTLVPELMYSSGATESNNLPNGTNNHLKFKLTVPKGQPGGKYITNVKLTLTE